MRCYLKGYKDDRTCDMCKELNSKRHNRCKVNSMVRKNRKLALNCEYCKEEKTWEKGTNEYGWDEDYLSTSYICEETKLECTRSMNKKCLDMFVNQLDMY